MPIDVDWCWLMLLDSAWCCSYLIFIITGTTGSACGEKNLSGGEISTLWPSHNVTCTHEEELGILVVGWCCLMLINSDWCWLILIKADWFWLMLIDADWCWYWLIWWFWCYWRFWQVWGIWWFWSVNLVILVILGNLVLILRIILSNGYPKKCEV